LRSSTDRHRTEAVQIAAGGEAPTVRALPLPHRNALGDRTGLRTGEMMIRRTVMTARSLLLIPVLAVAVAACGSSDSPDTAAPPAVAPAGERGPAVAPAAHDGRQIEITGDDTIKFNITEIRAKPGERLSVTLINKGQTPKFSMGHNWVLLAAGVDAMAFVVEAAGSPTTDYVPAARKADMLAATKLLGPAEQDTVTFTAPTAPGRYVFLCSFPGHYQVGMHGVLIVE
jgi:azurin